MPSVKRANPIPLPSPPKPFVLETTGSFDGDDGKWSTFWINLGDDGSGHGQNFKVLISTSSPVTLVPGTADWCNEDCASNRGLGLFQGAQPRGLEQSNSWSGLGQYSIPLPYWWTDDLAFGGSNNLTGYWGSENLGMDETSKDSLILGEQYVVSYTVKDFFLGSLGLAVGAVGPTGAPKPTFLNNFYGSGHAIASLSYGYTAGAYYRNNGKGVLGSAVLGGYDKSRLKSKGTSIQMPSEKNNSLIVGVQAIWYAPNQNVEPNRFNFSGGFSAVIDSTLPYLILPDDVCDKFQFRFGLQFDKDKQLYTVNATAHQQNTQQNATVSFKIGSDPRDTAEYATIDLPYAAFDQQVSFPIAGNATQYFPIRKSSNGVYVLGRTFLQEAYIIVDYERTNFTVAPALTSEPMPDSSLVTIFNKTYTGIPLQTQSPNSSSGSGLSPGAIAGIVVGIILAFIIASLGAFCLWRKRRNVAKNDPPQYENPPEIETVMAGNEIKNRRVSELTGSEAPHGSKPAMADYYPVDRKNIPPISEMSPETTPAELYSPPQDVAGDRDDGDYFTAGVVRQRGAKKDRGSSGYNTPNTPIAELPGDNGEYLTARKRISAVNPTQGRGTSDTSLPSNIDEVLAGKPETESGASVQEPHPTVQSGETVGAEEATVAKAEAEPANTALEENHTLDRRPSHSRGLSDSTIKSDTTAVSQPSPDELEQWARNPNLGPDRPMSPPMVLPTAGEEQKT